MNFYYDNAATSFPKPTEVAAAIKLYLEIDGAPYGRSFYEKAFRVSSKVEECRDKLAELCNIKNAERLTFTPNATFALNSVMQNFNYKHKKVLISSMEHNAVMRPLNFIKGKFNVQYDFLPSKNDGLIDLALLSEKKSSILKNCDLIIISHMSNINGIIQPIKNIKKIVGNIPILLDGAQSAGHTEINIDDWGVDFLALTGHKSLFGPTGTGALYTSKNYEIPPLIYGGTGSNSQSITMPLDYPDIFEAGTPNIVGIYGLLAALQNRPEPKHSKEEYFKLIDKLALLKNINIFKANKKENQGELFSITHKWYSPSEFALKLYNSFNIETRVGLHCSPSAHQKLGSFPLGCVRFALSPYHTLEDLKYLYSSIKSCQENEK